MILAKYFPVFNRCNDHDEYDFNVSLFFFEHDHGVTGRQCRNGSVAGRRTFAHGDQPKKSHVLLRCPKCGFHAIDPKGERFRGLYEQSTGLHHGTDRHHGHGFNRLEMGEHRQHQDLRQLGGVHESPLGKQHEIDIVFGDLRFLREFLDENHLLVGLRDLPVTLKKLFNALCG